MLAEGKIKKLRVFDFDDTLITSNSYTIVTNSSTEEVKKLTPSEFAVYNPVKGDVFDFSAFNRVINGKIIKKQFDIFAAMIRLSTVRTVILTARNPNAIKSIKEFLKNYHINNIEIIALNSTDSNDKASWIASQIKRYGYTDVFFVDDSMPNINAVRGIVKDFPTVNFTLKLAKPI